MSLSPDPVLRLGNSGAKSSTAPKGRKTTAQGNALGNRPPTNPSTEGAKRSRQESCEWLGESKVPKETFGLKIPAHWRWSTFGDLSERVTVGHVGSMKDEYREAGIPFLRGQNVRANRYDSKGLKYVSATFHKSLKKSALEPFDIVVTRSGDVGIACVIPEYLGEANCSDLVIIKRPQGIDSHFAAYYLNSVAKRFITAGKVGVAITHFNTKSVADLPVPLPALGEQRRIVARIEELFSRLDAGVVALRHAKAQLQRYRKSVLAAAVTGQLTQAWREQHPDTEAASELLKRISDVRAVYFGSEKRNSEVRRHISKHKTHKFRIPENWHTPTTWAFASLLTSCQLVVDCHNKTPPYVDSGIPLIRTTNVRNGKLAWPKMKFVSETTAAHWSQRCTPESGDILFTREAPAGEAMIIPDGTRLCMGQRMMLFRTIRDLLLPSYLLTVIRSHNFQAQYGDKQVGVGVQHLRVGDVESLVLPVPPLAEQYQIVAEVEARTIAIDHLEAELDRQITRSNRLRQSTLSLAFQGSLIL